MIATETQWMYYTTTVPGTVFVYASLIDGKSATRSTNTSTTSSTMLSTSSPSISSPSPTSTFVLTPNTGSGYNGGVDNNPDPDLTEETLTGSGNDSSSPTPKIVGGIIGGVAGIVLFAWIILLLIRRHKQKMVINRRVEAGYGGPLPEPPMIERSSAAPIAPWGFGSFGRNSRQSAASEPVSEERGFYKVSGRKLPPAIGGPRPDMPARSSSFYQEEENRWLGGPRTVTPVASPTSSRPSRYSGGTQTSASPTASGFPSGNTPFGLSFTAPPPVPPPSQSQPQFQPPYANPFLSPTHGPSTPGRIPEEYGAEEYQGEIDRERERANTPRMSVQRSRDFTPTSLVSHRDGLGRSLPSLDGSRTSRFTEDIV
ncbi:hypothetical protein EX30DRAFT_87534 [Ascodesmis nigricans]|uniref:Uncharacterized protein n=1 Tax=Ascodesmis nigricans TaxID=341454 RepID=A0A4S2N3D8_9PEZI|nr:hypothetical protein EX30DRAFT_87534 [Ascodesmis nigricans]